MQEDAKMIEEEERKKKVPTKIIRELHRLRSKYHFKLDVNWAGANDLSSGVQILCFLSKFNLLLLCVTLKMRTIQGLS